MEDISVVRAKTVAFYTLGCKLNFSETSGIARKFIENGYQKVDFHEKADLYVINTCSVTEHADKKCRQAIHKVVNNFPEAFVAVIGCYSQLKADEIAEINGVDLVLGTNEKFNLIDYIGDLQKNNSAKVCSCGIDEVRSFEPAFSSGDRTRSFLKIQDGCDYSCSYCTIPLARGISRNNSIAKTVEEARKIRDKGIKEIVLTGVNIGDFGKSTNESFFDLIQELDRVEGIERYRISSIEPNLLTVDVVSFVAASKRFAPHFHIPLQAGCDKILKLMQRRYLRETFRGRTLEIKNCMPKAAIGVDVIAGFPGETEDDFIDTYQFLESLDVSYLHVFTYSERKNTIAANMEGKVHPLEKEKRSKMLHQLSVNKRRSFYQSNLGRESIVLFESQNIGDKMFGFTANYIKVETPFDKGLIGKIKSVNLVDIAESGNVSILLQV
jgi:threonylcarbamoyladenosine tRNA methylthiotransferase MtaB